MEGSNGAAYLAPRPHAKSLICGLVPGSCLPNWLDGKPRTVKPLLSYSLNTAERPAYCGVRPARCKSKNVSTLPAKAARVSGCNGMARAEAIPQRDARLTTRATLPPITSFSGVALPSISCADGVNGSKMRD